MAVSATLWQSFATLCETLAGTRSKLVKQSAMAEYLRLLDPTSAGLAVQYLTGKVFPETDGRKLQLGSQAIVRALEGIVRVNGDRFQTVYRKHGDLGATAEELLVPESISSKIWNLIEIAKRLDSMTAARGALRNARNSERCCAGCPPWRRNISSSCCWAICALE